MVAFFYSIKYSTLNLTIFAVMNGIFLFIGGPEIFVILLIVVMLFGADKIPEIARGLGKGMRQIKDATNDIKREINESAKNQGIDTDFVKDINNEINEVKDNIDDFTGPIKRSR
ncbi:sec-independent protein translocase protein TatA [Tenacibaculum lutimaris]|uniref:Sec-independent protein translocase protein TatA n=2 Tax=Flavobacteriaceae TaxID=49546 RepID=A0A420E1Z5_9FLAO|nr:sec-independent protein translocase protein TatA [Tenacibaculum lutimaris]